MMAPPVDDGVDIDRTSVPVAAPVTIELAEGEGICMVCDLSFEDHPVHQNPFPDSNSVA